MGFSKALLGHVLVPHCRSLPADSARPRAHHPRTGAATAAAARGAHWTTARGGMLVVAAGLSSNSCGCRPSEPRLRLRRPGRGRLHISSALQSDERRHQQEEAVEGEELLVERSSPAEVKQEIQKCYQLVHKLGRGVVYLGSSRIGEGHPHYERTVHLAREIALLLDCTTWSGVGPGLMDAAVRGALEANKPVGGFKISKESGDWSASSVHPYLPPQTYLTCRFFSARKHGLVDAAVRNNPSDMTAVVALPGGIGTLDEVFEILALIQLARIGSKLPVPFLLMNYDSFYTKLLDFLDDCEEWGTVARGEVASLWKVCNENSEAVDYLSQFYGLTSGQTE